MNRCELAPSLLSANFANLGSDVNKVYNAGAKWLHIDVMDGVFVPNISFGAVVAKPLKKHTDALFDFHLMIENPDKYVDSCIDAGADYITVHYEACRHLHRSLYNIKDKGVKAGVVLNPATPISLLEDVITDADMVLLMSVNPGYGGQKYIENTYKKISQLKELILKSGSDALIQIDGGVSLENVAKLKDCGAEIFVAGSSVFGAPDIESRVKEFMSILKK